MTFLLVDIDDATRAWDREQQPRDRPDPAWRGMVDDVASAHGGYRPGEQGDGDSLVAAFAGASDAVAAALDTQRRFHDAGFAARVAVHTGEARLADRGGYTGPAITRGAHLRSVGHPGQVLVSDATRLVVADCLPDGVWWRDLGSHRFTDLGRAERVWQLCHDGLPGQFPPLRSLDAFAHNLPVRLTPLVGRRADTETVRGLLRDSRLVTLTGTGGVGKTRLALQVGAELIGRFDGGVWWVELGPLSDPGSLPGAVVAATGGVPQSGRRAVEVLADQLDGHAALFVFDNCEHVVAACATFVEDLLTILSSTVVLATSRQPLSVPGETVWRVPSLGLPDLTGAGSADWLERSDAARLFVDRARRARPGLALTGDAADAVAEICHRLDGIPLSIELAAARCRNLGVEQIARRLDDRFRLLTGGARTVVARQQTMKASIDWSHELLDASERIALRRLAVFAGPFTVAAAEAVIGAFGDIDCYDVFDLVDHLADRSLVTIDELDDTAESRYRLLETIRQFALERLVEAGELSAARDAHAAYWAQWAEGHNLFVDGSIAGPDAVVRDMANVSDAARWALRCRAELLQPLMLATGGLLLLDVDSGEPRLVESALDALEGVDDVAWAYVAVSSCMSSVLIGSEPPNVSLRERAAAIAAAHDLTLVRAWCAFIDAIVSGGDPDRMESASSLFAEAGSPIWSSTAGATTARWLASMGHLARATDRLDAARATWMTGAGIPTPIIGATLQVALVRGELTDVARVARGQLEAFEPPARWKPYTWTNLAYEDVARVAFFSGERNIVAWAADALERGANSPVTRRYADLAAAHLSVLDHPATPASSGDRREPTVRQRISRSALGTGFGQRERPYLAIAAADPDWIATQRQALARFAPDHNPLLACYRHLADAVLALHHHDNDQAEASWHDLLALASAHGFGLLWIDALEGLAIWAARAGADDEAARLAGAAATARDTRSYRYRYPHALETPDGSHTGRTLTLQDATTYARRARGERRRPTTGWASLTPTELEVVRAIAAGLTNSQAAHKLFVSVPTIKTHLSHIYTKLGVNNRTQLAATAATHTR